MMGEEDYKVDRTTHLDDSFVYNQAKAIDAAKDLRYPPEVVEKLKKCKTMGQLSIVMATARHTYL